MMSSWSVVERARHIRAHAQHTYQVLDMSSAGWCGASSVLATRDNDPAPPQSRGGAGLTRPPSAARQVSRGSLCLADRNLPIVCGQRNRCPILGTPGTGAVPAQLHRPLSPVEDSLEAIED